jgi:hypothetical protein
MVRPAPALFTLFSVAGLTLTALPAAFGKQYRPSEKATLPLVQISGPHSKIAERSYRLLTSAKEWNALWHRHTGKPVVDVSATEVPAVNFDKSVVVAVFHGPIVSDLGIVAHSMVGEADRLVLRYDHRRYGRHVPFKERNKPVVQDMPYGFFVLPRTDKPIVLEEATYTTKSAPPVFVERARLIAGTAEQVR